MDSVEAPKTRTVELRGSAEEQIVEAKQVQTLEHSSRAGVRGSALHADCSDDLYSSERARDSAGPGD